MKLANWLKHLLSGMAIGIGSAIPGVSGGTIAVILKVYENIIDAVSNIFKQFTKSIKVLLPLILGLVVGLVPTIILMHEALGGLVFATICIFAGFIIGSFPKIAKEVKGEPVKKRYIVILIISLLFTVGLGVGSALSNANVMGYFISTPTWFYFVLIPVGLISSIALVVPGISGGMLLILLGFYRPLIDSTVEVGKECLHGNWANFGHQILLLLMFGIGVIVGFIIVSKVMHRLLEKYRAHTYYGIVGFILGSIVALFFNYEIYNYYKLWAMGGHGYLKMELEIPLGIILLVGLAITTYLVIRKIEIKEKVSEE